MSLMRRCRTSLLMAISDMLYGESLSSFVVSYCVSNSVVKIAYCLLGVFILVELRVWPVQSSYKFLILLSGFCTYLTLFFFKHSLQRIVEEEFVP